MINLGLRVSDNYENMLFALNIIYYLIVFRIFIYSGKSKVIPT